MTTDTDQYGAAADMLKALAHPVRLCIIKGLLDKGECNVTHMQSCLNTPQSTVSQHLQKLKAAGVIMGKRKGLEVYYSVCDSKVADLIHVLLDDDLGK